MQPDFSVLREHRTINAIFERAVQIARSMNFDWMFYCCQIPVTQHSPHEIVLGKCPDGWLPHYNESDYRQADPALKHAFSSIRHAIWTPEFFSDSIKAEMLYLESKKAGFRACITIPVRGVHGEVAALNIASAVDVQAAFWTVERIALLHMLAIELHDALMVVYISSNTHIPAARNVILTARETEVLAWAADGKTAWETSRILNISERTVLYHLDNATDKLGASNKVQAVARAIALRAL